MQTITVECRDNAMADHIYSLLSSLPKSKLKIIDGYALKANKETLDAIYDIEKGKNCESFSSVNDMFKAYIP